MFVRKLCYSVFIAIICFGSAAFGQIKWTQIGSPGATYTLQSVGGKVYALRSDGFYVSSDEKDWKLLRARTNSDKFGSPVVLPTGEMFLFAYAGYVTSIDGGANWTTVSQKGFSTRLCVSDDLGYMYSGQNNPIQRSTDRGATWQESSTGTSSNFFDIGSIYVSSTGDIYAGNQGITGGMVYRSTNHGDSWKLLHNESMTDVTGITVSNGTIWIAYYTKLIYSDDDGKTWKTALKTPNWINSLYFTSKTEGFGSMYKTGIVHTIDHGITWDTAMTGARGTWASNFLVTPMQHFLVGTDSGMFMLNSPNAVKEVAEQTAQVVLTPNPAQNSVNVETRNADIASSQFEIYDVLGRKLPTNMQQTGARQFTLNTSLLEPGSYYLISHIKSGVSTSKLMIQR
ncbi:MAG: T9SS type A sorting domain-containing protein [Candidatus Kapaibacterium sp.]|jgi:hypothetical protein